MTVSPAALAVPAGSSRPGQSGREHEASELSGPVTRMRLVSLDDADCSLVSPLR